MCFWSFFGGVFELIFSGSGSFYFHKYSVEISYRAESALHGNACYGHICSFDELAGVIDAQLAYVG